MNKKGLTLVELLAVIAIIALMSVIIFPQVTSNLKSSTEQVDEATKKSITEAAKLYLEDHVGENNFMNTGSEEITLRTLVEAGHLTDKIKSSKEGRDYNLDDSIVIINRVGEYPNYSYTYEFNLRF